MILSLNDLAFVLGDVCIMLGGYVLYMRHRNAKRKKRQREFLAREKPDLSLFAEAFFAFSAVFG